jgi:extracellular matrix regulatory protein A
MYVDVGFSNYVEASKIITISRPDSSPIRRMAQAAKESGRYIDLTQGKKTRSIIVSSDQTGTIIIGSAVQASTIISRLEKARSKSATASAGLEIIGEGNSE